MADNSSYSMPDIWVNYRILNNELAEVITEFGRVKEYKLDDYVDHIDDVLDILNKPISDLDINFLLTFVTTFAISAEDIFCLLKADAASLISLLLVPATMVAFSRLVRLTKEEEIVEKWLYKFQNVDIRYVKGYEMILEALTIMREHWQLSEEEKEDLTEEIEEIEEYLDDLNNTNTK